MNEVKKTNSLKTFFLILTSFLIGVIFSFSIGKYINENLWKNPENLSFFEKNMPSSLDLSEFWDVYGIVKDNFYWAEDIKKQEIIDGAIKWMVSALGDKHSEFMDPDTNKKFQEALSGDFEGIGAVVEIHPLGVRVDRLIKGSPAKEAGIETDDILVEANGEELQELDLYDAVDKIKGPAGTQVILKVLRANESDFLEIPITRQKIQIPSVESEVFDENIGYISLNMFGETTTQEFINALEEVQNTQGIIIDLRDNGWGYLQSAVEILSEFIPNGEVVVETKYRDSFFNKKYYSAHSGENWSKKIVVLINGNSASASEITAGALREYNKAILVGEKSYGKGSVQQPFEMNDGSLLKLTIANWYTSKGKSIEKEGITPDIIVKFQDEDFENKYDRQLEEAKKVLKNFIEIDSLQLAVDQYIKNNTEAMTSTWTTQ